MALNLDVVTRFDTNGCSAYFYRSPAYLDGVRIANKRERKVAPRLYDVVHETNEIVFELHHVEARDFHAHVFQKIVGGRGEMDAHRTA